MPKVMVQEAKEACVTDQLCGDIEAGIGEGIHATTLLNQHHAQEDDWGFPLIDARNEFNEDNRTEMLWAIRF